MPLVSRKTLQTHAQLSASAQSTIKEAVVFVDLAVHEVFNFVDAASLLAELFQSPRSDSHHDCACF